MRRGLLIALILVLAPLSMAINENSSIYFSLENEDTTPMYSYGSNSQNLSFTTTLIESEWNTSITALAYDDHGNLSYGGQLCAMFPQEFIARNLPDCIYQNDSGVANHSGYSPAVFGQVHRNGSLANLEIINSSLL